MFGPVLTAWCIWHILQGREGNFLKRHTNIGVIQICNAASRSVDKKCGNITNWDTSRMSLKSRCNSIFNHAIYTAEIGLNSKTLHSIPQICAQNHEKCDNFIKIASIFMKNTSKSSKFVEKYSTPFYIAFIPAQNAYPEGGRFLHFYDAPSIKIGTDRKRVKFFIYAAHT